MSDPSQGAAGIEGALPASARPSVATSVATSVAASMTTSVAILGGGPIGLALALMLARVNIACTVIESRALSQARTDARLLALSRGSVDCMWPLLQRAQPTMALAHAKIKRVRVSSAGQFGSTTLTAAEFGVDALGLTMRYGHVLAALHQAALQAPGITLLQPARVVTLDQQADAVCLHLDNGSTLDALVVVRAEGDPAAHPSAGPSVQRIDPQADAGNGAPSWGIVSELRFAGPHRFMAGDAIERFTRDGPLALLPAPERNDTWSLVWCMPEERAAQRLALSEDAFCAALASELGPRLGVPSQAAARQAFALRRHRVTPLHEHRVVHVGNAAQTLHPVAGQGFNLGLRDGVVLAALLADAFGESLVSNGSGRTRSARVLDALSRHHRARRVDRSSLMAITTLMPALFASRFAPLASARALALMGLDTLPAARRMLGHLFMFGLRS